ncbi:MAG: DUF3164 family protein [Porphyromonadaceae bacterium]|nr:DUF3164 family protein [Porphyromonadaceae bacterium]
MEEIRLTGSEAEEFRRYKEAKERDRLKRENRETYKQLVDEVVREVFPKLQEVSKSLACNKQAVYWRFADALKLKEDIFNTKADQRSNTFSSADGLYRITLGNYQTDGYDDTVNEGIAKVKEVISSFANDDNSRLLVEAVMKLLSRDAKGNLKASRVMQLRKLAADSGNAELIDGVEIIEKAYRPQISKTFVRAEYKDEYGRWISVPLGMTEA